jgi:hypothetical protein
MSKFNYGLGKTYRSASEAFRDADYAEAITRPQDALYDGFWAFMGVLAFVAIFAYCFWLTIGRF